MVRLAFRILRGFLALVLVLGTVVAGYLLATLFGAVIPAAGSPPTAADAAAGVLQQPRQAEDSIYLVTSALHADFAIAVDDSLKRRFAFLADQDVPLDHPKLRYLVFGWGARAFYVNTPTLADIRPGPALKGVFGDRSVMHVAPAGELRDLPGAVHLYLPAGGRERLLAFIEQSFARSEGAPLPIPGAGYGIGDAFYEGQGRFNIFNPCNIWVAEGLRRAGLATGAWTPTTHSLKLGLRLHSPSAIGR